MSFANNEYYTFNRCGDFEADWKPKNEPTSTIGELPSDEQLLGWVREKLGMPSGEY